jgi:hypothetical protein
MLCFLDVVRFQVARAQQSQERTEQLDNSALSGEESGGPSARAGRRRPSSIERLIRAREAVSAASPRPARCG